MSNNTYGPVDCVFFTIILSDITKTKACLHKPNQLVHHKHSSRLNIRDGVLMHSVKLRIIVIDRQSSII